MALTDQPYLPLYVDDWMNNNKLKLSTPAAHGLMISIMCIMHKENQYGTINLKANKMATNRQESDFASVMKDSVDEIKMSSTSLDNAIEWIASQLDPDDVFKIGRASL